MAISFDKKDRYTTEDLLNIMALLRGEGGCPWDREQTHQSIRSNLLEETHEALEAIDTGDNGALREELGDVLMQVVFHAQMAAEEGAFSFDDVVDGLCQKLIVRHPHVFGEATASSSGEVLQNWDAIKRKTKGDKTQADLLSSVPRSLPPLMRAEKVQNRARRVGFDWPDISGALEALDHERQELRQAMEQQDAAATAEEFGDFLFSAVNVARFLSLDPEQTLTNATEKFIRRFQRMEQLAEQEGLLWDAASLQQLNTLWDRVKKQESTRVSPAGI